MPVVMRKQGFTLIEIVVSLGVFALLTVGLYTTIQYIFKSVYQSRLRILETSILNEQLEIIRNLTFSDVGIIAGSPPGVLTRTVTTTRNGITFTMTRTIRNYDDPADGTIGGSPNDTAPADYKFVDVDIECTGACTQLRPLSLSTIVGPRYLEGDPTHGALFIHVFDVEARPVAGASVRVVATSTNPTFDFVDTTDDDGMLRIVDLPEGVNAYHITVTKENYTSDGTVMPSASVPNPNKPPATVVAQDLTEISFTIEPIATINVSTINAACGAVGSIPVTVTGSKLAGTSPDVPIIASSTITGAGTGTGIFTPLGSDIYAFSVTGYDVRGTIPQTPVNILAGAAQPLSIMVGPVTTRSLLVNVRDSVTKQPLPNATVVVTSSLGYSSTLVTDVGFLRQTDWSDGPGQETFVTGTQYFTDDSNVDTLTQSGNVLLRQVGSGYASDGILESSTFDFGANVNYGNIVWEPLAQVADTGTTSLRFQIATSASSSPASWSYRGPDGNVDTYYTVSDTVIAPVHDGEEYMRYRLFLSTASSTVTPVLSDVVFTYTNSCLPPGQAYFSSLADIEHGITVSHSGYQTFTVSTTPSLGAKITIDLLSL